MNALAWFPPESRFQDFARASVSSDRYFICWNWNILVTKRGQIKIGQLPCSPFYSRLSPSRFCTIIFIVHSWWSFILISNKGLFTTTTAVSNILYVIFLSCNEKRYQIFYFHKTKIATEPCSRSCSFGGWDFGENETTFTQDANSVLSIEKKSNSYLSVILCSAKRNT